MKSLRAIRIAIMPALLLCGFLMPCICAFGQGSILIQNVGPNLNAPVRRFDGALIPAGDDCTVELWVGTWPGGLMPLIGSRRRFVVQGFFGIGDPEVAVPGFPPGSRPWCQVRIWYNPGGSVTNFAQAVSSGQVLGESCAFELATGLGDPTRMPPVPAPPLAGMPAMTVGGFWYYSCGPPLSRLTMTGGSANELILRDTSQVSSSQLWIAASTNLSSPSNWTVWSVVTNAPAEYVFTVPISTDEPSRFFRVVRVP
jgi:hypothetical protein